MICRYCNKEAIWCNNAVIYGYPIGKSCMYYYCIPCDAYVGCHNNTRIPLGTIANAELRQYRRNAHLVFDKLWKSGKIKRKKLYQLLSIIFGKQFHIGECEINDCEFVINLLENHLKYSK